MEERWRVFQKGADIGLFTAQEIREALRSGRIDPFDQVAREGSKLRMELVEVDEIFAKPSDPEETQAAKKIAEAFQSESTDTRGKLQFKPAPVVEDNQGKRQAPFAIAQPPPYAADPRANQPRVYWLQNRTKGRLGPLSAAEIQSLYLNGVIDSSVRVRHIHAAEDQSVRAFLAAYAGSQKQRFAATARRPESGLPSITVTQEINRHRQYQEEKQWLNELRPLILVGLIVGLILGVVNTLNQKPLNQARPRASQSLNAPSRSAAQSPADSARNRRTPRLAPAQLQAPPPPPPAPRVLPSPPKTLQQNSGLRPEPRPRARPQLPRPPLRPPPEIRPRQEAPRLIRPPRPTTPAPPPAGLESKIGQTVTLASMRYQPQALDACPIKCRLVLKGPSGVQVTAVFFKGTYLDQLRAKGGLVTVSGILKREGANFTLILGGVQ